MARFIITGEYKDKATRDARRDLKRLSASTIDFGRIAKRYWGLATAAATYYVQKGLRASIRAAMEDEKTQRALAFTLGTVAGASEAAQIAAEANIKSMMMTYGVADDQLRPALARLARVTGSVTTASEGLDLALSLSAATGASLEQTTRALSRAYVGNYKALKGLGINIDDNLIKNKQTSKIISELQKKYGAFAKNQLDTTAVKFSKIKVAAGEATEAIGTELINAIDRLINRNGKIDGVGKSLQDTADYVADLIGGTSILADQASSSGFVDFLRKISSATNTGFALGKKSTGLEDIKKILDAIKNVNVQEKVRLGLIRAQNNQIKSARYEEELAKKKLLKEEEDKGDLVKKTVEQLMAEEAARRAGFKLTEDLDSIQTVAAAKRLEEGRQYKAQVLDAAQAQFEAIRNNVSLLDAVWQSQLAAFDVFLAALKAKAAATQLAIGYTSGNGTSSSSNPLAGFGPGSAIDTYFTGVTGGDYNYNEGMPRNYQPASSPTNIMNVSVNAFGTQDFLSAVQQAQQEFARNGWSTSYAGG